MLLSTGIMILSELSTDLNWLFRNGCLWRDAGGMTIEFSAECKRILSRQAGVIACSQSTEADLEPEILRSRFRYGYWQRLQRGVYAVHTGEVTRAARVWAALLRVGVEEAVLSHYTAAEQHGLLLGPSQSIHISVPEKTNPARYGKIPGVVIHRSDAIVGTCHPAMLPRCTRIEDTVLDLLKITHGFDARYNLICRAIGTRRTTADRILAHLAERQRFPGRKEVQLMLSYAGEGLLSWLELRWADGVEKPHGIPAATRQARVRQETGSKYLDNLYEKYRICVELDGSAAHPETEQWRDNARDRWNLVHGKISTMRFGVPSLRDTEHQCVAAADLATVLSDHGPAVGHPCSPTCPVPVSH